MRRLRPRGNDPVVIEETPDLLGWSVGTRRFRSASSALAYARPQPIRRQVITYPRMIGAAARPPLPVEPEITVEWRTRSRTGLRCARMLATPRDRVVEEGRPA